MTECVIGIDGGGTRSTGLCVDLRGNVLARAEGGPLNYNVSTYDQFRSTLAELIQRLTTGLPKPDILRYVIGTASLFEYAPPEDLGRICESGPPQSKTCLLGDALVALYGATAGRPGLLVISGTGSIAAALTPENRFHTSGGFGPLIGGDPGSAFWMGGKAVLAAARSPRLAQAVCHYFNVSHLQQVVQKVYGHGDGARRLAGLAGALAITDLARDEVFLRIQNQAGHALAEMVLPLVKGDLARSEVLYGSGSVLQGNPIVRAALEDELQQQLGHSIKVQMPALPPASGAALLALDQVGQSPTESILNSLGAP